VCFCPRWRIPARKILLRWKPPSPARLDAALARFALAVPQIKKNVLNACAETVAADGLLQVSEAELLRAIADSLDCPIPPFIPSASV
jgi:hypothetical protein